MFIKKIAQISLNVVNTFRQKTNTVIINKNHLFYLLVCLHCSKAKHKNKRIPQKDDDETIIYYYN